MKRNERLKPLLDPMSWHRMPGWVELADAFNGVAGNSIQVGHQLLKELKNLKNKDPHKQADPGKTMHIMQMVARADLTVKDENGDTPLLFTLRHYLTNWSCALIETGQAIHIADKDGNKPLALAALTGRWSLFSRLKLKGADLHARNRQGHTVTDLMLDKPTMDAAKIPPAEQLRILKEIRAATSIAGIKAKVDEAITKLPPGVEHIYTGARGYQ